MSEKKKAVDSKPANIFADMIQDSAIVEKETDIDDTQTIEDDNQDNSDKDSVIKQDPMELKNFSIRMPVSYKDKLTKHFKERKGMNLSNGLREVLYTYMREQGLIK